MKAFFLFCTLLTFTFLKSQGLELMPVDKYNKLKSPPQLAGSSNARTAGLAATYVIPSKFFPNPGNQGSQPSCTAWATGYGFMSFYQACKNTRTVKETKHIYSPSYIYQNIKANSSCSDCSCGTYISDALEFLKTTGNVSISDCPYDANSCKMPSASLKTVANQYKIKDWFRVEDVKNFNELKTYLTKDQPVIIAAYTDDVFSNFYNKTENDVYKRKASNDKSGLHAMLLVGYDNSKNAFKILNSWGTKWGTNGYVWVDYESFRAMIAEGYVVQKDYVLPKNTDIVDPVNTNPVNTDPIVVTIVEEIDPIVQEYENRIENETISEENFAIYAYSEEIRTNRYYFTTGFEISDEVIDQVAKIVYVYDDPSFSENYVEETEGPNFATWYEGWGCYENMQAIVYFKDKTSMTFEFNSCELIEYYNNLEEETYETESVEITPSITAYETDTEGQYEFLIELRGVEKIKDQIVKVVYDRNHESFKQRYLTTTNKENNFESTYIGWGCLEELNVTIYYNDDTYEEFTINMCDELGW